MIRARPPEETLGSHLDDEDRRDVYKLQSAPEGPPITAQRETLGLEFVHISGACTHVGSSGRTSFAQGYTLGWGMFGPQGADASGYALGGFDIAWNAAVLGCCALLQRSIPACPGLSRSTRPQPQSLGVGPEGAAKNSPT